MHCLYRHEGTGTNDSTERDIPGIRAVRFVFPAAGIWLNVYLSPKSLCWRCRIFRVCFAANPVVPLNKLQYLAFDSTWIIHGHSWQKILIIESHSTQGSQGPVGEPGIQVSYLTKLFDTSPACLLGGNCWETVLISNCFPWFPGSSRSPWIARNSRDPREWCKNRLCLLLTAPPTF